MKYYTEFCQYEYRSETRFPSLYGIFLPFTSYPELVPLLDVLALPVINTSFLSMYCFLCFYSNGFACSFEEKENGLSFTWVILCSSSSAFRHSVCVCVCYVWICRRAWKTTKQGAKSVRVVYVPLYWHAQGDKHRNIINIIIIIIQISHINYQPIIILPTKRSVKLVKFIIFYFHSRWANLLNIPKLIKLKDWTLLEKWHWWMKTYFLSPRILLTHLMERSKTVNFKHWH